MYQIKMIALFLFVNYLQIFYNFNFHIIHALIRLNIEFSDSLYKTIKRIILLSD